MVLNGTSIPWACPRPSQAVRGRSCVVLVILRPPPNVQQRSAVRRRLPPLPAHGDRLLRVGGEGFVYPGRVEAQPRPRTLPETLRPELVRHRVDSIPAHAETLRNLLGGE